MDEDRQARRRETQARWKRQRRANPPADPGVHGTIGAYDNGCRCVACRTAKTQTTRGRPSTRQRIRARRAAGIEVTFTHGTAGYDHYGCRCPVCSDAYAQRYAAQQGTTAWRATLKRQPWTPEELAVARDRSLTAKQAALQLGRTYAAVKSVRTSRGR